MDNNKTDLLQMIGELKNFPGIIRKRHAGLFRDLTSDFFGEDAGYFELGDYDVVITADGIWHRVLEADLYWGGFVSILVNIHDIYAMGARPVMAVNVVSARDEKSLLEIKRGMKDAVEKFGVRVVKGHVHPDANENSVDVAMLGIARKGMIIRSNGARDGDYIIAAVDVDGSPHRLLPLNFDSTNKPGKVLIHQLESMVELAEKKLVNAGKDISNAGILGTVAMMLESSGKGGYIDLRRLPLPENISLIQWLKTYPACGFVVSAGNPDRVLEVFRNHGLCAEVIGRVDDSHELKLRDGVDEAIFFDFRNESIFGLK
ncbi:AIR synthase related protein [Geoglobus acetivorans]|uniref:Methanogenesis marker protein 2 n=1 Tax=Geoglobus acetivorans TaxID=565033 RepID=A0A0A7GIZ8_GEOAI|nr:methanogenesis marker protein 2 [Geoglobus acetivorans]